MDGDSRGGWWTVTGRLLYDGDRGGWWTVIGEAGGR